MTGSASSAVLAYLQSVTGYRNHAQIVEATGKTPKSVDHACLYLRNIGLIQCECDFGRNKRYLKYAVIRKKG